MLVAFFKKFNNSQQHQHQQFTRLVAAKSRDATKHKETSSSRRAHQRLAPTRGR